MSAAADPAEPTAQPVIRRSMARNMAALLLSQLTTWVIALATNTLMPRFLGPDHVGQLVLAGSIWSLATVVTTWGTNTIVTLELARDSTRSTIVGRSVGLQLVLFAGSTVVVAGYSLLAGYSDGVLGLIAILGVTSLIGCVAGPVMAAFTGIEQLDIPALVGTVVKVVSSAGLVLILVTTANVHVVAAFGILSALAIPVVLVPVLRRSLNASPRPSLDHAKGLMRAGWPYMLNDATFVIYVSIDTIVISLLATDKEIGWYAAADTLFGTLFFIPNILMTSMFPVLARLDREDTTQRDRFVERSFAFLLIASVPLGLGTFAIATPVARLLFGADFTESGPVLGIFGIVIILTFVTVLLGKVALASDHARFWASVMALATVLSVPLDIILVPWTHRRYGNGAIGGALAYIVTEAVILAVAIPKVAPGLLRPAVLWRTARCLTAGFGMLAAVWPFRNRALPVPIGIGVVTFVVLLIVLRVFDDEDRSDLRRFSRRIMRRTAPESAP